jgi:extracellular elastinolytic metalloproteinase
MHLRIGATLVVALALLTLGSAERAHAVASILPSQQAMADLDARTGSVAPSSAQQQIVSSLGANATWNQFGTPKSLIKYGGYLATGLSSDPVAAAKTFITNNAALFRLSSQGVANLQLLNDSPLVGSEGHAVLFRQTFGGLPATQDGLITVGVVNGKVAYVSSSSAGDGNAPPAATLSPQAAWTLAAANVGHQLSVVNLSQGKNINGWQAFAAPGLNGVQRVRLTALPTPTQGVRPAYESIVLDNASNGEARAYTEYVDAVTGKVWVRHNDVQQLSDGKQSTASAASAPSTAESQNCDSTGHTCTFDGTMPGTSPADCGVNGPFVAPANLKSVDVASSADVLSNDIILFLDIGVPGNGAGGSSDEATSPEAVHYEPSGGILAGTVFYARTCASPAPLGPFVDPLSYHGELAFNDAAGTPAVPQTTPKWKAFTANPPLGGQPAYPWNYPSTDNRIVYCWLTSLSNLSADDSNCQYAASNIASRVPWDADPHTGVTTETTSGNNATTGEAWVSPLTAGGAHQQPQEPTRAYIEPWTNAWFNSGCNPANLTPGGNDILAAVTNLFVGHNRMHDFSYNLGFTETNFNAQLYNFGNGGKDGDPEEGDVEAGALTGGAPSYEGRDNANQITLNDGIPPITNQYLFQPIAGAFYSPCVDGDFDTSVFGHEYTHLISNRMVAGPDSGLSGAQAGAMGESWSDLDAMEYQFENGFDTGVGPYVIGPYATGNPTKGIRDYAIDHNPLNYSDISFDTPGLEVHADGEIWNGVNYAVRQALIDKWNAAFPVTDTARQKGCAAGNYAADACPGNRRWVQIMYDAWLLDQSGVSMVDARNSYLAADMMRFGGANQTALWNGFAKTGLGMGAVSNGTGDDQPTPSFASPNESNASITFNVTAPDQGNAAVPNAKVYVGDYEARVTPVATSGGNGLTGAVQFVAGTYNFVAKAPGYGLFRFTRTFTAGQTATTTVAMPTNWASSANGATVAASNGTSTTQGNLIDDTEDTQWDDSETAPVGGQSVTVALGGGAHTIGRVQVSAMIGPGEGRFSALRSFHVDACNSAVSDCAGGVGFSTVYTSDGDAFPGLAPRPVAPDLIMRSFTLSSPVTATHLRLVVDANQCTGGPAYAGTQDNDPSNEPTDCTAAASALTGSGSTAADEVYTAEFEAFGPTAPPAAPDLQVTALTASTNGENLTATVSNTGNAAAGASTTQFTFDGKPVCAKSTPAIAAGGSATVLCKQKAPQRGTHTLVATADSTNAVAESNESNNSKTITFVKK